MCDAESSSLSTLRVETERERQLVQQLKEATDNAVKLQDGLNQARDRERQLQEKQGGIQPQTELDDLQKKDIKRENGSRLRNVPYFIMKILLI